MAKYHRGLRFPCRVFAATTASLLQQVPASIRDHVAARSQPGEMGVWLCRWRSKWQLKMGSRTSRSSNISSMEVLHAAHIKTGPGASTATREYQQQAREAIERRPGIFSTGGLRANGYVHMLDSRLHMLNSHHLALYRSRVGPLRHELRRIWVQGLPRTWALTYTMIVSHATEKLIICNIIEIM